jgi:hypothetical protein
MLKERIRRSCAKDFAGTEASYVLVRLLQDFEEIEVRDEGLWRDFQGLISTNFYGTRMGVHRKVDKRSEALGINGSD